MENLIAGPNTSASDVVTYLAYLAFLLIVLGGMFLVVPGLPNQLGKKTITTGILCGVFASLGPSMLLQLYEHLSGLPWWVLIFIGGLLVISALQAFVALFLGWRAANSFAGNLTVSLFKGIFAIVVAPIRGISRIFRGLGDN